MNIVREFVTRLSFTIDRRNLDRVDGLLASLRTRFSLFYLETSNAVRSIVGFIGDIATAGLKAKDLADYASLSLKEFTQLQTAVEKLALPQDKFNEAIQKLAIQLKEASLGYGELFNTARRTGIEIRDQAGNLLSVKEVLFKIFDYINAIPDKSEQLRSLGILFDPESAGAWLRVISVGRKQFEKLVENEKEFAQGVEDSIPKLEKLNLQTSQLSKEWKKLSTEIYNAFVPILLEITKAINHFIDVIKSNSLSDVLSDFFQKPLDVLAHFYDTVRGFFPGWESNAQMLQRVSRENKEFWENVRKQNEMRIQGKNSNSIVTTNNFQFNVPPSAEEQQAHYITESIRRTMDDFWQEKTREVINNNPTVE